MNNITKKFLEEVKEERIKRLQGLEVDIYYFNKFLHVNNPEVLRTTLSEENKKLIKDDKGNIKKDTRDMEFVRDIETKINKVENVKKQLDQFTEVRADIIEYLKEVQHPDIELVDQLDEIAKL